MHHLLFIIVYTTPENFIESCFWGAGHKSPLGRGNNHLSSIVHFVSYRTSEPCLKGYLQIPRPAKNQ